MKKIFLIALGLLLISCMDGAPAKYNEDFVPADRKKELPFEKLVGTYELDKDSKERFHLPDSVDLKLEISKNKILSANDYFDVETRKLKGEKYKSNKLFYINDFKDPNPTIRIRTDSKTFNNWGGIEIYYRKKDSAIALYVLIPPIKDSGDSGDYLRYIKMK